MANVGISDDYAVLDAGDFRFYYGYEHTDDDGNWLFLVRKQGKVLFQRTAHQLNNIDELADTSEILLIGIAEYIESKMGEQR